MSQLVVALVQMGYGLPSTSAPQHWPFPRGHLGLGYAYILTHPGIPCLLHEHLSDGQLRQTIADLVRGWVGGRKG